MEYPRNYALEIYVGNANDQTTFCRLYTPKIIRPHYDATVSIAPGTSQEFAVSPALRALGTRKMYNAITIECDRSVDVMGVNKETYSNDAFLAFPVGSLGTTYYTVSYGPATIETQFAVVATDCDGVTTVDMTFNSVVVWRETSYATLSVQLQCDEVFQAQSVGDLTGSKIVASRPVAVFSGNIRTKVALSASRDHLSAQLPPTEGYGTEFMLVPTSFRTVGDLFRIVCSQDGTTVSFRSTNYNCDEGEFIELDVPNSDDGRMTSNNPVMVMQIVKSQDGKNSPEKADPCFISVPPVNQWNGGKFVVTTPQYTEGLFRIGVDDYINYLMVIVPVGRAGGIRLNGQSVGDNPMATQTGIRVIDNSAYIAVDIQLNTGGIETFVLSHADPSVTFSGYLVGIADRESYCV